MRFDTRGQSQVLGAMLIFAFLVSALGIYQAFIVPQQTGDVELEHASDVKDDFADVHAAITNAGSTNEQRTTSVKLGTRYPSRMFALNPPPVAGRVGIRDLGGDIQIAAVGVAPFSAGDICGDSFTTPKTLNYDADYNVLTDSGNHGYETSVTYHEVNGNIVTNDQVLLQGTTIRLLPLTNGSLSTASIESQSLEFHGGVTGGTTGTFAPIITLPTDLSQSQWQEILADENTTTISVNPGTDTVTITLPLDEYTFRCTPIGEGQTPRNSPSLTPGASSGNSSRGSAINPIGPNEVELTDVSRTTPGNNLDMTYQNNDTTRSRQVKEVRVPYGTGPGGSVGETIFIDSTPVEIGGGYTTLTSPLSWSKNDGLPGGSDEVVVTASGFNARQTSIAIVLKFDDGEENVYFAGDTATGGP